MIPTTIYSDFYMLRDSKNTIYRDLIVIDKIFIHTSVCVSIKIYSSI